MDDADRAQVQMERAEANYLRAHRRVSHAVSRDQCINCGDPIPEARRVAVPGCERCAFCQEIEEGRACQHPTTTS